MITWIGTRLAHGPETRRGARPHMGGAPRRAADRDGTRRAAGRHRAEGVRARLAAPGTFTGFRDRQGLMLGASSRQGLAVHPRTFLWPRACMPTLAELDA